MTSLGPDVYAKLFLLLTCLMTMVLSFNVEIATYGNINVYSLGAIPLIAPAIEKALMEIRSSYSDVFNLHHNFLFDKTAITCIDVADTVEHLISKFYYNVTRKNTTDMIALISPGCGEETGVAALTYEWNIPTFFGTLSPKSFRNRILSPQTIASGYDIFIAYDSYGLEIYIRSAFAFAGILKTMTGLQVNVDSLNCSNYSTFEPLLTHFRAVARNLWFFVHPKCLRLVLIKASEENMTNGDYVYFTEDIIKNSSTYGVLTWQEYDKNDEAALEAFRSLLVFTEFHNQTPTLLSSASVFEEEMIRGSAEFYNYTYPSGAKSSIVVKNFYESFLMFAQVLNETLTNKISTKSVLRRGSSFDGAGFVKKFLNRTFTFPTGTAFIDSAGERAEEIALTSFDKTSGTFIPMIKQDRQTFALQKLEDFRWLGKWPLRNTPECGFSGTEGPCLFQGLDYNIIVPSVCGAVGGLLLFVYATLVRFELRHRERSWDLNVQLVKFLEKQPTSNQLMQQNGGCATYQQQNIWLKKLKAKPTLRNNRATTIIMGKLRSLSHTNLTPFVGVLRMADYIWIASGFCSRGNLSRLMKSESVIFDAGLRQSLITDVLQGLSYIHKSPIKFHGALSDRNCLIDQHFTAKIAEAGFDKLLKIAFDINSCHKSDIWTAPEICKAEAPGTQPADMFACGVLIYESIPEFEINTFSSISSKQSWFEFSDNGNTTPEESLKDLLRKCLSQNPTDRPTITELCNEYDATSQATKGSFIDEILKRMNRYANDLEAAVEERTLQLSIERKKCDTLLLEMLPRKIVDALRLGKLVEPEVFESATVSFSDIIGFPEFVSVSPPMTVVAFLNESHSIVDRIVTGFDAYKVETISDSYMVASGLPVTNGNKHVLEICRMSIVIREIFNEKFITTTLNVQTGIHTGACAAAVIGLKRPRYCL